MRKNYFRVSDNFPTHTTNFGGMTTSDFVAAFSKFTGQENLQSLTLDIFNHSVSKKQLVAVDRNRKWCPACYQESAEAEAIVYDQLIWSIKHVDVCRIHNVYLESSCRACKRPRTNKVSSFEVIGMCQHCREWLGWSGKPFARSFDSQTEFQDWCTGAAEGILGDELSLEADFRVSIADALNQMVERDFAGIGKAAADALGRPKSLLHEWRKQTVVPRWDALLTISFVMKLPMALLLSGKQQTLAFGDLKRLPAEVMNRRQPRKRATARDWKSVGKALKGFAVDRQIVTTSLQGAAKMLGVCSRTLRKKCPDEVAFFREHMKGIKTSRKIETEALRQSRLLLEISSAVDALKVKNIPVTRRSLNLQLRLQGICLRHREVVPWLATAKQLARKLPD